MSVSRALKFLHTHFHTELCTRSRKAHLLALASALLGILIVSSPGQAADNSDTVPAAASAQTPVPTLIPYTGVARDPDGKPITDPVSITFLVYEDPQGGDALWYETALVTPEVTGKFFVQLGSTLPAGLPTDLFASGKARWLEVQIAGQEPFPRTLLTSVPYAMKSADAATLGGEPPASFVTQQQLSTWLGASGATSDQNGKPLVASAVTGSGMAGYVPLWTGVSTLGNSVLAQVNSDIGIGTATPASTLDVKGASTLRGTVSLPAAGTATATAGVSSPALQLGASAYSSTTKAALAQNFQWQALAAGNNTASPTANLALLFGAGPAAPNATGLSIASNGLITFAPNQTFPVKGTGGGTITGVTAGTGLTGGGTSGNVTVSLDLKKAPLLSSFNTFASGASFGGESWWNGSSGDWMMVVTNTATTAKGVILGQAQGSVTGIEGASPAGEAIAGLTTTGTAVVGQAYGEGGAAYFWSQAAKIPTVLVHADGATSDGLDIVAHGGSGIRASSGNGYGGVFSNNSTFQATLNATNTGQGNAGYFSNSSTSHAALAGVDLAGSSTAVGVIGQATLGVGVDAISTTGPALSATAGTGWAGLFTNNSTYQATVNATNNGNGNAGYFANNSPVRVALAGINASTDGNAIATYGSVANGTGVYGISQTGVGVFATTPNGTALVATSSASGKPTAHIVHNGGTIGLTTPWQDWANTAALWVDGELPPGNSPGNHVSLMVTAGDEVAGSFRNNSQSNATLYAYNVQGNHVSTLFKTFQASSPDGTCGIGGAGNLTCTGQVKTLVATAGGARMVETYAVHSPENWMEDFGSAQIKNGVATVIIDPTFAETVSESDPYHIFLTPNGDSKGLYVANKTATSFEVRESGGGTSSLSFDYRIVAKRRGFEAQRHVDVTERFTEETRIANRGVLESAVK